MVAIDTEVSMGVVGKIFFCVILACLVGCTERYFVFWDADPNDDKPYFPYWETTPASGYSSGYRPSQRDRYHPYDANDLEAKRRHLAARSAQAKNKYSTSKKNKKNYQSVKDKIKARQDKLEPSPPTTTTQEAVDSAEES